jgi:hypothetical protein
LPARVIATASISLPAACEPSRFGEGSLSRMRSSRDRGVGQAGMSAFASQADTPIPALPPCRMTRLGAA